MSLDQERDYKFVTAYKNNKNGKVFYHNTLEEFVSFVLNTEKDVSFYFTYGVEEAITEYQEMGEYLNSMEGNNPLRIYASFDILYEIEGNLLAQRGKVLLKGDGDYNASWVGKVLDNNGVLFPAKLSKFLSEAHLSTFRNIIQFQKYRNSLRSDLRDEFFNENLKYIKHVVELSGLDWNKVNVDQRN